MNITQSLTAYTCRICEKFHTDDLLVKTDKNETPIDLGMYLQDFFKYIKNCKIDRYTGRALLLSDSAQKENIGPSVVRFHIQPKAGKALENFSVVNYHTNMIQGYRGEDHSAVYTHNVLFYIKGQENVFVFHHYGQSGCKTAFLNTFNSFLAQKGLKAHLDVLMSNDMFCSVNKYIPEKISLITTYSDISSDKTENIGNKTRKKTEQEVIISLNAPRAANLRKWFKNITTKNPSIDELKSVLIQDNFPSEFEDAKLTLKFGKVRRRISLSEFTGMLAEYDITDRLETYADGTVSQESLYSIADEYALQFFS